MDIKARIFVAVLSFLVLSFVINLVRRKYLKENYATLWVITCGVMIAIPFVVNYFDRIAHAIGIYYPPALLYLIAILFIFVLILHFSVIVSKLSEQNKNLIQTLGILDNKVQELEAAVRPKKSVDTKKYGKEINN